MRRIIGSVLILAATLAVGATVSVLGDATEGGTVTTVPAAFEPASRLDSVVLVPMEGWPQHVTVRGNFIPLGLAIADINHDSTLEVIVGSTDSMLYVWDYQGQPMLGWPRPLTGMIQCKVAVGDINRDGTPEIVVATKDGYVHALGPTGEPVSGWPQDCEGVLQATSPTLYDADADDTLEVIMTGAGKVFAWNHDGTLVPGWPVSLGGAGIGTVSAGDVDGDGTVEICVLTYNTAHMFDAHGDTEPGWPYVFGDGAGYSQPLLYDLDRDGKLEVGFSCYPHIDGEVYILRSDGSNFRGWPQSMFPPQNYVCPVAGGVLSDSVYSIFCGGHLLGGPGFNGWTQDGDSMPGWPVWPDILECSPVVFDLEGNWRRCVMIASNTTPGYMCAYHGDGTLVEGFPIETPGPTMPNSPVVGDVDADGILETGLLTIDGTVSLWKAQGIEYHPYMTDWGTWYHDNWNTGQLHPQPPTGLIAARGDPGVHLFWSDDRKWHTPCYNVYRSTVPDSGFIKLASPTDPVYDDTSALGDTTYYYAVTISEEYGIESRLSARASLNPTGVKESPNPEVMATNASPTVARGVLLLPASPLAIHSSLFDMTGSRVMALRPGANDVSRLVPGVYFVREDAQAASHKPQVVRKVVLTR